MRRIRNTTKLVKDILQKDERTRNSDSFLYFRVIDTVSTAKGLDITKIPVTVYLLKMNEWGFPPFESVRRARQKLQRAFPELEACEEVAAARAENEVLIREKIRNFIRNSISLDWLIKELEPCFFGLYEV